MRNYVLDKAVGLLQSFKTKLPLKTSGDIESGMSDATQNPPIDGNLQHCPGHERSDNTLRDLGGDDTQDIDPPLHELVEERVNQQPQFTDGPARFVIASDGSKECMALLVTDTLIARLRDVYEDSHHLSGKQGPLAYARREVRSLESSIYHISESIQMAENHGEVEELQKMAQQQETQRLKICQRRDELEKGAKELERNVTSSKAHIQWVLDTAMKEADLLEEHRPLTPVAMTDIESNTGIPEEIPGETRNETGNQSGKQKAVQNVTEGADLPQDHSDISANEDNVPEELQSLRQAAWESYNENLATMHKVQAIFDNRQQSYETDLADYQQGFENGIYKISRSEFDRSKIHYGQKVTRALINAEEAFEAAKEEVQAIGAIGSDFDDDTSYYGYYEESWPETQLASYLATKDWGYVHDWLANFPEPNHPEEQAVDLEPPEVDDWYADEVDPADSISQVDFDDCRKDIDRWENIRFDRWEDMRTQVGGPEVQVGFLVRSIETLKRRHSVSLCTSTVGEWVMST